jgi:hypothetical protein
MRNIAWCWWIVHSVESSRDIGIERCMKVIGGLSTELVTDVSGNSWRAYFKGCLMIT